MKILIFGASGMVGQGVLRECLLDPRIAAIVSVGRSAAGKSDPKLSEIVVPDLADVEDYKDRMEGFDACLFCLGVSSVGMSEEDYSRITYNLTITVARMLAPRNPGMTFIYVTGAGTSRDSASMWSRVKARTEDALAGLSFKASYFFRPGFIQPLHGVVSKTRWYMTIYSAIRPISPMLTRWFPGIATTTERLGKAMINVAARGYPRPVLESADINEASGAGKG